MNSPYSGGRDSSLTLRSAASSQATYSVATYRGPEPSVAGTSLSGGASPWSPGHVRDSDAAAGASPLPPRTRSTLAGFDFSTMTGGLGTASCSVPSTIATGGGAGHRESFAALAQRKNPLGPLLKPAFKTVDL
jgi:hypothetical protein